MPKSPKVSFGRTRAPSGSNELMNPPDPIQMGEWEDFLGTQPENTRDEAFLGGSVSRRNRKSKRVSGPSYSSAKDLEYKGT